MQIRIFSGGHEYTPQSRLTLIRHSFWCYNSATTGAARLQRRKENVADLSPAVKLLNFSTGEE